MYYKLIKEMPKHKIGELLYPNIMNDNVFYEWLESPNYILPDYIVENDNEYFEVCDIDWVIGEKIYFIDSQCKINEQIFNPKIHLKMVMCNNAFKNIDSANWISEKFKSLLNNEIVVTDSNNILKVIDLLQSKKSKDIDDAVNILNKIIK
jgi:hypothetical protein